VHHGRWGYAELARARKPFACLAEHDEPILSEQKFSMQSSRPPVCVWRNSNPKVSDKYRIAASASSYNRYGDTRGYPEGGLCMPRNYPPSIPAKRGMSRADY